MEKLQEKNYKWNFTGKYKSENTAEDWKESIKKNKQQKVVQKHDAGSDCGGEGAASKVHLETAHLNFDLEICLVQKWKKQINQTYWCRLWIYFHSVRRKALKSLLLRKQHIKKIPPAEKNKKNVEKYTLLFEPKKRFSV